MLIGYNVVAIGASSFTTSVLIGLFGREGVIYATIAMSLLVIVFAELMPIPFRQEEVWAFPIPAVKEPTDDELIERARGMKDQLEGSRVPARRLASASRASRIRSRARARSR